jgi:DNA-binding LacI/PurR family transcriptional regulator
MDDVAARAGVSRALVSLVMRGSPKVSDRRRHAVIDAARELRYRPNAVARSLAERRSNTFGVVIDDLRNPYYADVVESIHDAATEQGFRLLLNAAWRTDVDEGRSIETFLEHRVAAIIVLGTRVGLPLLAEVASQVPLVVIGAEAAGIDVVVNDDERGSALLVEHLVDLGHSRVAHVDGGQGGGAAGRRRGYVAAMEAAGLVPDLIAGDLTEASGTRAVDELLRRDQRPTALFCANDLVAVAAIDRLDGAGLAVPGDISVVGYDNTSVAALGRIGLTTIDQPSREMGRAAVRRAMQRLDGGGSQAPMSHVLEPELMVRSTSGPPPT